MKVTSVSDLIEGAKNLSIVPVLQNQNGVIGFNPAHLAQNQTDLSYERKPDGSIVQIAGGLEHALPEAEQKRVAERFGVAPPAPSSRQGSSAASSSTRITLAPPQPARTARTTQTLGAGTAARGGAPLSVVELRAKRVAALTGSQHST